MDLEGGEDLTVLGKTWAVILSGVKFTNVYLWGYGIWMLKVAILKQIYSRSKNALRNINFFFV